MKVSRTHAFAVYLGVQAAAVSTMALVPGVPDYGEQQQYLGGAVIIDLLLAYGLYRGSRLAWRASVLLVSGGLFAYPLGMLANNDLQLKCVGVTLLVAVQFALLFSSQLRPPPASSEQVGAGPYRDRSARMGQ